MSVKSKWKLLKSDSMQFSTLTLTNWNGIYICFVRNYYQQIVVYLCFYCHYRLYGFYKLNLWRSKFDLWKLHQNDLWYQFQFVTFSNDKTILELCAPNTWINVDLTIRLHCECLFVRECVLVGWYLKADNVENTSTFS